MNPFEILGVRFMLVERTADRVQAGSCPGLTRDTIKGGWAAEGIRLSFLLAAAVATSARTDVTRHDGLSRLDIMNLTVRENVVREEAPCHGRQGKNSLARVSNGTEPSYLSFDLCTHVEVAHTGDSLHLFKGKDNKTIIGGHGSSYTTAP